MKFSYKFQNLLGSVYDSGNLVFFPDGSRLLSPCGNKVNVFDLKNGRSEALPLEIQYNIARMDLSPDGALLLVATEKVQLMLVSMISGGGTVLHRKDFKNMGGRIADLKFSPDGRYYAVCGASQVNVYLTPGFINGRGGKGGGRTLTAFRTHRIIKASYEEATSIAWNSTSQLLLVTSKDFSMRVYPMDKSLNTTATTEGEQRAFLPRCLTLTAHNDLLVGAFFSGDNDQPLNIYKKKPSGEGDEEEEEEAQSFNYRIERKKYLFEDLKEKNSTTRLSAYSYHAAAKLLVAGFNNGAFMLYELSSSSDSSSAIILIHSLQLSTGGPLASIVFNSTGHWIALGSSVGLGNKYDLEREQAEERSSQTQLVVWEWQSESFILKQSGYSNGVTNSYECLAYSPDASLVVTGGTDGRIKVWSTFSGFCLSTFSSEHKGPVTAVEFVPGKSGKVFLSASLDGTVKAFDLNRYRCFRTLAAPSESKPAQFICLAVDNLGGDFVAAGSHNFFEIFPLTGRLMEILTGHEGPVASVKFSPTTNTLYSCSWDATVRIWSLYESGSKCTREVIKLGTDGLDLAVRGDGAQLAVATLNGAITFFDAHSGEQTGVGIEGREDLGVARYRGDVVKQQKYRYFSSVAYSADGEYVIAGGRAKYVCVYAVREKLLLKRYEISNNLSLDGFQEFVSKRAIAEFGFHLSVVKHREDNGGLAPIALPGLIAVHQIRFSPTMRAFAFVSTEGVLVYSLDRAHLFDPYQLEASVTPAAVKRALAEGEADLGQAVMMALKLNERSLLAEAVEAVPLARIPLISAALPLNYVERCSPTSPPPSSPPPTLSSTCEPVPAEICRRRFGSAPAEEGGDGGEEEEEEEEDEEEDEGPEAIEVDE
ncbi:U3 snoRNP protein [Tyrophagus putrescentiae]|nr:U3 snoRNP protein [Tyrophagus putrescentiae]